MITIDADDITKELEQIRNRHGKRPLVTSARDAALVELASPIPSVRWRAKQVVKKANRRKAVSGSKHYTRVRKSLKKRVYTFYWSHQEERRFHGWKGHQHGEHVFLTLEEWIAIKTAALAIDKRWTLKKRDYNKCWTWGNTFVLVGKYRGLSQSYQRLDPRAELERPESCPRPDSRFVQSKKKGSRPAP